MVTGKLIPVIENSEVAPPTDETVTLDPVALKVALCDWLDPTTTLPKLIAGGATANCPGDEPLPDRLTVNVGLLPFEVTVSVPELAPEVEGVNVTLITTL